MRDLRDFAVFVVIAIVCVLAGEAWRQRDKLIPLWGTLFVLCVLAVPLGVLYVVVHFVVKYW
jgi:hypothetical protein